MKVNQLVERRRGQTLADYQSKSRQVREKAVELYQEILGLKGMWDQMENIPTKQQPMYDEVLRMMSEAGAVGEKAYSIMMKLQRYR